MATVRKTRKMTAQKKSTSQALLEQQASTSGGTQDLASPASLQNTTLLTKFEKHFKYNNMEGTVKMFKKLSKEEKKALVNATLPNNIRPLEEAVKGQNEALVKFLLECGADPNQTTGVAPLPLLYWAVAKRNKAITRLLIKYGADLNWTPSGVTALGAACSLGDRKLVRLLLRKGAALEARDFRGETCLFHAMRSNQLKVVKLLLKKGASMDVKNIYGESPVGQARRYWPKLVDQLNLGTRHQPVRNVDSNILTPLSDESEGHHSLLPPFSRFPEGYSYDSSGSSKTNSSSSCSEKESSTAERITETKFLGDSASNKNESQTSCSSSDCTRTVFSDSSVVNADHSFSVGKINSSAPENIREATMGTCHREQSIVNEKASLTNGSHSGGRTSTVLSNHSLSNLDKWPSYREGKSPANECTANAFGKTSHEETSRPRKVCSENVLKDRKNAICSKTSEKKPLKKAFADTGTSLLLRAAKVMEDEANRKDLEICESLQKAVLMGMPPTPSLDTENDDSWAALSDISSPGLAGEDTRSSVTARGDSTVQSQGLSSPTEVSNGHCSAEDQSGNLSERLHEKNFQNAVPSSPTLHEMGPPSAVKEHSQASSTVENLVEDRLIQSTQSPAHGFEDNPIYHTEDFYSLTEEERNVWVNQFLA